MFISKLFYSIMGVYILLADLLAPILMIEHMDTTLPPGFYNLITFFVSISHVRWFYFAFAGGIWIGMFVILYFVWLSYGLIMNNSKARSHFILLTSIHLVLSAYLLFIFNIEAITVFDQRWWLIVVSIGISALVLVASINIPCAEDVDEMSFTKSVFLIGVLFFLFILNAIVFFQLDAVRKPSRHTQYAHKKLSIPDYPAFNNSR